jgi:hypothetical protein
VREIQDADVVALHPQVPEVTVVVAVKLPPPTNTLCVVGESAYAQGAPAWLTVTCAEPPDHCTVSVPLRLAEL